jgi:hypothetical protein
MKHFFAVGILGVAALVGCDADDTANSGTTVDLTQGCSNVFKYCPSGYTWSQFVSDEEECKTTFNCVYQLYTGNCHQMMADATTCLSSLTSASGCAACNDKFMTIQSQCAEPTSCL